MEQYKKRQKQSQMGQKDEKKKERCRSKKPNL
jgi:hypothetical protein